MVTGMLNAARDALGGIRQRAVQVETDGLLDGRISLQALLPGLPAKRSL
jgi:hypothetical protein